MQEGKLEEARQEVENGARRKTRTMPKRKH